jgi:hypothetical protein
MSKRSFSACGAAALLVAGVVAASAYAKPPDLPVDVQDTFAPPAAEAQQPNNGYEVPPPDPNLPIPSDMPAYEDSGVVISGENLFFYTKGVNETTPSNEGNYDFPCDAASREFWQALCSLFGCDEQEDQGQADTNGSDEESSPPAAPGQPSEDVHSAPSQADTTENVQRLATARRMYKIGERCLRKGNLDMAYNCFQEAHLLAPTSSYGRRAIDRLSEIDECRVGQGSTEAQESGDAPAQDDAEAAAGRLHSARDMYRIGERCRKTGDLGMAVNCFREAEALCPGSTYARRAAHRIAEIEKQRSADETAEPAEEQEAAPDKPEDNSSADRPQQACPVLKPIDKLLESLRGCGAGQAGKTRLDVIEEQSAPEGDQAPQDDVSSQTQSLPLYVSPPARRLVIKQEYPQGSDE